MMQEKQRDYYFDLIRIIAIFAVIAIHTDLGELYLQQQLGSISYMICLFLSMTLSFSPVIFFMISGALLLEKEESISVIWKKRILRILTVTLIISLLYFILDVKSGRFPLDIGMFLLHVLSSAWITPLWYLYAYLCFLICLPFLRGMAKAMNETSGKYLFILAIFLQCVLPELQRILPEGFALQPDLRWDWLLSNVILYPMLGYTIAKKLSAEKLRKYLPVLLIADIGWMVYQTYLATAASQSAGQNLRSDGYRGTCALLHAVAVFFFFRFLQEKRVGEKAAKYFAEVGSCVFGIYLFHGFFLDRVRIVGKLKEMLFLPFQGAMLLIPSILWMIVVFVVVGIGVWLIKRIPAVKKFI